MQRQAFKHESIALKRVKIKRGNTLPLPFSQPLLHSKRPTIQAIFSLSGFGPAIPLPANVKSDHEHEIHDVARVILTPDGKHPVIR